MHRCMDRPITVVFDEVVGDADYSVVVFDDDMVIRIIFNYYY